VTNPVGANLEQSDSDLPAGCVRVFSNSEISQALDNLAGRLNQQLADESPVALCVMQGGLIFAGNLIPRLHCMLEVDYIHATRYDNKTTGDDITWKSKPASSLKDRTVLIMDDILDEGKTLKAIIDYCQQQGARKIVSTVLLQKLHDRCIDDPLIGKSLSGNVALKVDDRYVFGFGMDLHGQYRHLESIYALYS
jgi:hypoxanthine phosphoribosyltransferase